MLVKLTLGLVRETNCSIAWVLYAAIIFQVCASTIMPHIHKLIICQAAWIAGLKRFVAVLRKKDGHMWDCAVWPNNRAACPPSIP